MGGGVRGGVGGEEGGWCAGGGGGEAGGGQAQVWTDGGGRRRCGTCTGWLRQRGPGGGLHSSQVFPKGCQREVTPSQPAVRQPRRRGTCILPLGPCQVGAAEGPQVDTEPATPQPGVRWVWRMERGGEGLAAQGVHGLCARLPGFERFVYGNSSFSLMKERKIKNVHVIMHEGKGCGKTLTCVCARAHT